jgi:hypothetical protein
MNQNEHIYAELIAEYLNGTLSPEKQEHFRQLLDGGHIRASDLIALQTLYRDLGNLPVPDAEPGSESGNRMRRRFEAMLEDEKTASSSARESGMNAFLAGLPRLSDALAWLGGHKAGFAMAFGLFLIGLLLGDIYTPFSRHDDRIGRLSEEVYQMREVMMISLLQNESPVERLRAVTVSHDLPSADPRVIGALLHTLNTDSNVNVRIAAVDALVERGHNPDVRRGLVESIARQESPLVQIALADAMLELQEPGAVKPIRKLLEQEAMDATVRNKLENTVLALL